MGERGWVHRREKVGEVALHWVEAGSGPTVILLHGFPDLWRAWRRQIPALVRAGFRVVAPDLRGYGGSDRPRGVRAYAIRRLLEDVRGLMERLEVDRVHLAGHDWGGVIAWYFAMHHPAGVDRLVIANAPHPAAYRRELLRGGQLARSWYAALFQVPGVPEWLLGRPRVREWMLRRGPGGPEGSSPEDLQAYRAALGQPGALTAMLNYYRAALWTRSPPTRIVSAPTLLLWGERDGALSTRLTRGLEGWVADLRVERFPRAGHWVLLQAAEPVNRAMTAFLRQGR